MVKRRTFLKVSEIQSREVVRMNHYPDYVLSEMRAISTRMLLRRDSETRSAFWEDEQAQDGERLRELFAQLDGWLCLGGYLPKEWEDGRREAKGQAQARRPKTMVGEKEGF